MNYGPKAISVIIPVYNRAPTLYELLAQLDIQAEQSDIKLEVIIVDDHSTVPLAISNPSRNYTLKTLRNKNQLGANKSRKIGFKQSQGEIIHFHDSDDLLGPVWLTQTAKAFSENRCCDMLITSRVVMDEAKGRSWFSSSKRLERISKKINRFKQVQRLTNRIGPLGGVSFSKSIIENFKFHDVSASQDWLMYDDALERARSVVIDPYNFFIFRKNNISRISQSPYNRARGYVSAAQHRYATRLWQKMMARFYCVHGAADLQGTINVKYYYTKYYLMRIAAWVLSL